MRQLQHEHATMQHPAACSSTQHHAAARVQLGFSLLCLCHSFSLSLHLFAAALCVRLFAAAIAVCVSSSPAVPPSVGASLFRSVRHCVCVRPTMALTRSVSHEPFALVSLAPSTSLCLWYPTSFQPTHSPFTTLAFLLESHITHPRSLLLSATYL